MRKRRSLKRAVGNRPRKNKLFVFSEDKNTEPKYLKAYERRVNSATIEVICESESGVPKTLLELAKEKLNEISSRRYKRENGENDTVWIVCDRDEHLDVDFVLAESAKLGIKTAYSNPCFEVWLILHVKDYDRDEHRHDTQKECEKCCPGYNKKMGKTPNFDQILDCVEKAEGRAENLLQRRQKDGSEAPFTTVFSITKAIREGQPI